MMQIDIKKLNNVKYFFKNINNEELLTKVKKLDSEFLNKHQIWLLNSLNLYYLISSYKGRDDIFFSFESDLEKERFISKYKKALQKVNEKKLIIKQIREKNELAVKFKKQLEETKHSLEKYCHIFKEGVTPFNHQIISAEFLNKINSGLLALTMGLGKTLTIIFTFELDPNIKKVLIITPNSLKKSFGDDIDRFFGIPYYIINSRNNKYSIEESKYFIVNIEYFQRTPFSKNKKLKPYGLDKNIDAIAIDESHNIANSKSNRTKTIIKEFSYVPRKILSSGTPIKSEPDELFTQLKFIDPVTFSNKTNFLKQFCGKFYNPETKTYILSKAKQHLDILHKKLQSYMIRYKTEEVIDLPEMLFTNIKLELSEKELRTYRELEEQLIYDIDTNEYKYTQKVVIIGRLRKYLSLIKLNHIKDLIDDMIDDDKKIVFVDFFKDTLIELNKLYKHKSVLHYGDQKLEQRYESIERWKKDSNLNLFIGSSSTTKEGLTLIESNNMFLNTLEWTPATCDQIFKRINRIGQEETCNYYIPLFEDTIDIDIYNLVLSKKQTFSKLIDDETIEDNATEYAIQEIIQKIRQRQVK